MFLKRKKKRPQHQEAAEERKKVEEGADDTRQIWLQEDFLKVAYWLHISDDEKLKGLQQKSKGVIRLYMILSVLMQLT